MRDLSSAVCSAELAGVADTAAHLDTVSGVVQKAFRQAGETTEGLHEEPGAIVTRARTVLARAFGGSVERLLADRFTDLDHLEALGAVAAGPTRSDRGPDVLTAELRTVALDCSTVARAMTAAGLAATPSDRKSLVKGQGVSVPGSLGGSRFINKKQT